MTSTRAALLLLALALPLSAADAQTPSPRLKPAVPNHSLVLNDADFTAFRHGMRDADDDDWAAVRQAIMTLENPVADHILLWRVAVSDARAPFSDLDRAIDELEGWPRHASIRREAEWKIEDSGLSPALIVAWFEDREPVTGEGRIALGEALIELGRADEGAEQIRTAWRTQTMRLSNQNEVLREHGNILSDEDHAARVDFLLWAGQRTSASRLLPQLSAGQRRVAEARIRLASRSSGVDSAVAAVPDSLTNTPGLVYERARWRRQRGLDTSLELLLELPDSYTNSSALESMWTERKLMILDLIRDQDFETAYELAAANGMESGVDFADAEFLAGWLALTKLDQPGVAFDHFDRLEDGVTTPVSTSRALYWQGRAAEAAGELEIASERFEAAAGYPTAYYGQLAILALGPDAAQLDLPPDPQPSEEARAAFNARPEIQALRLLAEVNADYLFRVFMYHFDDEMQTPEEQAMLTDIALEYLQIRQAVRAAKAGRLQGMILAERAYPMIDLPESAPVSPEAALTYSVIRQETEFDPQAISGAGARGLMQMMPATARQTARQLDLPYSFHWLTDDPNYNLTLGMAHLQEVVTDYEGSLVMALAAYNAGGHRVRRWVRNYGDPRTDDIDPIDWVESIPFSETRNYVQRIIENLQVYRARLNDGLTTPLNITEDMSGQFARDLPALPDDFVAALREAQAAEAAMEETDPAQGPDAPVLTLPEDGEDGGAER
ncbi:lytic transglycosylase domain-containing protein [Oceanicaulis sp. MMSF_3324]|uniref:lytic transglycosylase domain-containing protein n=1 Tax=Oceanicaulis sp. MMSF_3324 TaxID=3046702 RepID=UPI00273EEAF6|nr:lytic transglycosylase domain-containing protein [Oceanicaulis sp. MMSF_3324]